MGTMERLGESIEPVEIIGPAPCPMPGCKRLGRAVKLFGREVVEPCPRCQAEAEERNEAEYEAEQLRLRLSAAGARDNEILHTWSLASFADGHPKQKAAVVFAQRWVKRYAAGARENVFVYGPSGGGKTGLAWSVARELIETETAMAKFVSWREALETMKDAFRHREQTKASLLLRRIPVLVLDDLGAERPTDFARAELLGLVEHRMMNRRPIWVTSNFSPDELTERLGHDDPIIGKRIVSRVAGGGQMICLDAPDRRMVA